MSFNRVHQVQITKDTIFRGNYTLTLSELSTTTELRGIYNLSKDDMDMSYFNEIYKALETATSRKLGRDVEFQIEKLCCILMVPSLIRFYRNYKEKKRLRRNRFLISTKSRLSLSGDLIFLNKVIDKIKCKCNLDYHVINLRDILISSFLVAEDNGLIVKRQRGLSIQYVLVI